MTLLFLHEAPTHSLYKMPSPPACHVWGGGESAFGQMSTTTPPQWPAPEGKQTFLSTNLACLLAFERRAAGPSHTPFSNSTSVSSQLKKDLMGSDRDVARVWTCGRGWAVARTWAVPIRAGLLKTAGQSGYDPGPWSHTHLSLRCCPPHSLWMDPLANSLASQSLSFFICKMSLNMVPALKGNTINIK